MPNRLLRESICVSDTIDQLSWMEEVFFYRLIVNCDDFGRFDARPQILKSRLFPLKSNITDKSILDALNKLSTVGLVTTYECDGKPYLQLVTWEQYQQIRAKKSKYPAPDEACNQLISDASKCPRNPIQSESNPNPTREFESNPNISAEPEADSAQVFALPLNDGSEYPIYQHQVDEWTELYPAVDILQDLRGMKGWLDANKAKRKTKRGVLRFVTGWLSRTQDKGGNKRGDAEPQQSADKPKLNVTRL